jgi:Plasmid rolling circle replication initiator protein and truncated derivatives
MSYDCQDDSSFVTYLCPNCGNTYNFKLNCHSRTCPTCNKANSFKLIKKYKNVDRYLQKGNAYFVTPTIKNVPPEKLKDGVKKIRDSIKKLCNRAPYRRWFAGGLYAIEFTLNKKKNTFNIHAHMTVDSCIDVGRCYMGFGSMNPKLNKKGLKSDWYNITKDSFIIDWQKTKYPNKAVAYCLKYLQKDSDYYPYDSEVREALYKTRMISFFGCLYLIKPIENLPFICECGYDEGLEYFCKGHYSRGGYWHNGHFRINPSIDLDNFI